MNQWKWKSEGKTDQSAERWVLDIEHDDGNTGLKHQGWWQITRVRFINPRTHKARPLCMVQYKGTMMCALQPSLAKAKRIAERLAEIAGHRPPRMKIRDDERK